MSICFLSYGRIAIHVDKIECEAVHRAVANLRRDLRRVFSAELTEDAAASIRIYIGTNGISEIAEEFLAPLTDQDGNVHKEAYQISEKNGDLFICGSDRRGTIFGIYEFCEMIGVSPWHFFADVPIHPKKKLILPTGYSNSDYPSVEYRGIFINDEEELEKFCRRYMGEETIAYRSYEKIFELMLRLKLNYIWPAMHVNSFNMQPDCRELAEAMGIVVGTTHCDMLMRSNLREWGPWLAKKGYTGMEYDYSISKENCAVIDEYWRESIQENSDYEVCYTIGMRGVHDSGFETAGLSHLQGEELLDAKISLLNEVLKKQNDMLQEELGRDTMKIFVPYKEVLELYDRGLELPEDATVVWVDDNYGFNRRYPIGKEKERKGGSGIYYHNSYWAGRENSGSYVFICTIPLAQTRNELLKGYQEGIRKLWVTNFGALKPLEQEMSFYAKLAWEAGREDAVTNDEIIFLTQWIDSMFTGNIGSETAGLLHAFDQITNVRKIEYMDWDIFSQTAYGDEACGRIHEYERIMGRLNDIYEKLPKNEKDAFFQLILMKVHAAYLTNCMFYFADRSVLCCKRGLSLAAQNYTKQSVAYEHARERLIDYYNHVMSDGKWDGILTPDDFPPPRYSMYPACMPPLSVGPRGMAVFCIGEEAISCDKDKMVCREEGNISCEKVLSILGTKESWFEIGNLGEGSFRFAIEGCDWLGLSCRTGVVTDEIRILVKSIQDPAVAREGILEICNLDDGEYCRILVKQSADGNRIFSHEVEKGRICIEAAEYEQMEGWEKITGLGRGRGDLLQAKNPGGQICFTFSLEEEAEVLCEIHRYPSLDSVGRIRVGFAYDETDYQIVETDSKDSGDDGAGNWLPNVKDEVDKLYLSISGTPGHHTITLKAIDPYFAFSRIVLYTEKRKENNLGFSMPDQRMVQPISLTEFCDRFYPDTSEKQLRQFYKPIRMGKNRFRIGQDDVVLTECIEYDETNYTTLTPSEILDSADRVFAGDKKDGIYIHLASALANTCNAYTSGEGWYYCNTPFYQETGLAMYLRDSRMHWVNPLEAPALHYVFSCKEGEYYFWLRMQMWGSTTGDFALAIDGEVIPKEKLYGGNSIWTYSCEQVWEWVPVWFTGLKEGKHTLTIYSLSAHLRFDALWIREDSEFPRGR